MVPPSGEAFSKPCILDTNWREGLVKDDAISKQRGNQSRVANRRVAENRVRMRSQTEKDSRRISASFPLGMLTSVRSRVRIRGRAKSARLDSANAILNTHEVARAKRPVRANP